jgi:hypothetical protein
VCDNIRIRRSKIYTHEDFRGYQASIGTDLRNPDRALTI